MQVSDELRRVGQKAPSAKRCIKTESIILCADSRAVLSESTERQKVH